MEQYMMSENAALFGGFAARGNIKASLDPARRKHLGRSVHSLSQELWEQHRVDVVLRRNRVNFFHRPLTPRTFGHRRQGPG